MKPFKMRIILAIMLSLAVISCLLFSIKTSAFGDAIGATISPPLFEETALPGQTVNKTLKITNESDSAIAFMLIVLDFLAKGEEGMQRYIDPSNNLSAYSLGRWIDIEPRQFTLQPGEKQKINFTISIPKDAEPGGYYAAIFCIAPKQGETPGIVGIVGKVGSLVLLRVEGDVIEQGYIKEFSAPNFQEHTPVSFTVRFENTGDVHVKPQGYIEIYSLFGRKIDQMAVNEKNGNVLPESIRRFKANWNKKNTMGRYSAKLILKYGEGQKTATAKFTFWVIPWKIAILILIFVVFVIVFGIRKYRKRINLENYKGLD